MAFAPGRSALRPLRLAIVGAEAADFQPADRLDRAEAEASRMPDAWRANRVPSSGDTVMLALHYQNEVLHDRGRIRAAAGDDAWRDAVVDTAARLLAGARARAVPVVSVRIAFRPGHRGLTPNAPVFKRAIELGLVEDGTFGAEFLDGLGPRPGEVVVTHRRINAFFGSDLESVLTSLGARRLIVAGVATNSVVTHSVMHAVDLGFEVTIASDGCAAATRASHDASLDNLASLARIALARDILTELGRDGA